MLVRILPFLVLPLLAQTPPPKPQYPNFPSETPETLVIPNTGPNSGFDYTKKTVEIPMRDGVKLHTVILIPRGAKSAPILLTRTPYNAGELTAHRL
jgi:predicted acyl esterase